MPVKVELVKGDVSEAQAKVIAVGVYQAPLAKQALVATLDAALHAGLLPHLGTAEFTGNLNQMVDIPTVGALSATRIVLIGLGPKRAVTAAGWRAFAATASRAAGSGVLALGVPEALAGPKLRALGEGISLGAYRFSKYFTGDRAPKGELESVLIYRPSGGGSVADRKLVGLGLEVGEAVCLARDVVNEPPNVLNPEALAEHCRVVSKKGKLKITVLDKAGIKEAGMHLHYAVGQGSANEPRFIHMRYAPPGAKKKIAFVGKGLTFDSGGLCIKPAPGMGDMKSDMGGAAAVLGLMAALCVVKPNVEVHGIIGSAENMPDGEAYRPGDVFGSLDGKTVEIINTDAEGRLVLADALTYARQLDPDLIVDAATLTGACMVALGKTCSAFYTESEKLGRDFTKAAADAGESFWRMPLLLDMREQLKSDIADLKHTGERWGGSISAALFLREFVGEVPFIHCDVAGPVLGDRAQGFYPKGATGHPVLTFLSFVEALR